MRVSDASGQQTFLRDLQRIKSSLDTALAQVSSGKRVRFASDDSPAAAELMRLADEGEKLTNRRQVLSQARPWLQLTEQTITELDNHLQTALGFAMRGSSGTMSAENLSALADQVKALREQITGLTNQRVAGRYIFSGTLTDTQPFKDNGSYQGNDSHIDVPLDEGSLTLNLSGRTVFGEPGISGPQKVLQDLENALRSGDVHAVQAAVQPIRDAISVSATLLAQIGSRSKALEDADSRIQDRQLAVAQRASDLGSADMAAALSDVQRFQTGYQATLAAGARLFGPNFFNYLG